MTTHFTIYQFYVNKDSKKKTTPYTPLHPPPLKAEKRPFLSVWEDVRVSPPPPNQPSQAIQDPDTELTQSLHRAYTEPPPKKYKKRGQKLPFLAVFRLSIKKTQIINHLPVTND